MTHNTREVEELVDKLEEIIFMKGAKIFPSTRVEVSNEIHKSLQKVREEERKKARDLYQGLQMMFDQYCPNGNHEFMTAGETAEELLDVYTDLQCDCEKALEQQELDGHTRYCKALNRPEPDQLNK